MNRLDDLVLFARDENKKMIVAKTNLEIAIAGLSAYLAKDNDDLRDFLFECFVKGALKIEQSYLLDEILEKLREKKNADEVEK